MKKYKLIKDYPGSPELNSIVNSAGIFKVGKRGEQLFDGSRRLKTQELPYLKDKSFWEEVVEKGYKILSFKREGNFMSDQQRRLATLQKDGSYLHRSLLSTTGGSSLKDMMKMSFYKIYSVKRLSDRKIFTVGDLVKRPHYKQPFKINHIHIAGDMIWLHSKPFVEGTCSHVLDKHTTLREAIKYKQPLFTTEDGVEIFEGDDCYLVFTTSYKPTKTIAKKELLPVQCYQKFFSTKETAEEYVLVNKPCLSINDVKSLRKNELGCMLVSEKDLKELVKSKL